MSNLSGSNSPPPYQRRALQAGNAASLAGAVTFVVSAAAMIFLWAKLLYSAMGWVGALLGLFTAPLAAAYPFLLWLVRAEFPPGVFALWTAGVLGLAAAMAWASWGRSRLTSPHPTRRYGLTRTTVVTDEVD